jgi:hypothetical protein
LPQDNELVQHWQSSGIDLSGRTLRDFGHNLSEQRLVIGPKESVQRHEGDGVGVIQDVLDLHAARPRADRYDGRANQGTAEGRDDPLGTIVHQERNGLTRADV